MASSDPGAVKKSRRLVSLDAFRGITMILLVSHGFGLTHLEDFELWGGLAAQFSHVRWEGMHFWDLVQPFFMFIVGVAMPYSLTKRRRLGQSDREIFGHVVRRSLVLIFLGVVIIKRVPLMKGTPSFTNVLTQIGFTYFFTFLVFRESLKMQIVVTLVILVVYDLAFRFVPLPYDVSPWIQAKNLGSHIDVLLGFQFNSGGWVTINAVSTAVHTMWGAICGWVLMSDRKEGQKLLFLVAAGVSTLLAGYILSPITPIVKRIATSTFVLASGGWCFLTLAFLYWMVDIKGYKDWAIIVNVVGVNSIFIYMFNILLGGWLESFVGVYTAPLQELMGEVIVAVLTVNMALLAKWYICYWMYKRGVFIKI